MDEDTRGEPSGGDMLSRDNPETDLDVSVATGRSKWFLDTILSTDHLSKKKKKLVGRKLRLIVRAMQSRHFYGDIHVTITNITDKHY